MSTSEHNHCALGDRNPGSNYPHFHPLSYWISEFKASLGVQPSVSLSLFKHI